MPTARPRYAAQPLRVVPLNVPSPASKASWQHDLTTLADLSDYEWLTGDAASKLLSTSALAGEPVHRQLNHLRKTISAARAGLIVEQWKLRSRAASKFGELAASMYFTDLALQQATDIWTARYKASRISEGVSVIDYCCGIGGDLLALAERGPTTGWDRMPEMALLARANLRVAQLNVNGIARVGDAESQSPAPDEFWHIDPDRRVDGRRSTQLQWHSPGPELVEQWLAMNPQAAMKLAPATIVPEAWSDQAMLEWISFHRACRQQVAWFGELAGANEGLRCATRLSRDPTDESQPVAASFVGKPDVRASSASKVSSYVYDTDPALRAAGLVEALATELDLSVLDRSPSYLTHEDVVQHPLLTCFEVLDQLPPRIAPLLKHLRDRNIGNLEIKTRGVHADPEWLRKQLKLRGDESATLLHTRMGTSEIALLVKRVG